VVNASCRQWAFGLNRQPVGSEHQTGGLLAQFA
jgi:hypothetical protein